MLPAEETGVLVSAHTVPWEVAEDAWDDPVVDPSGVEFTLQGCRIRYPGQWAFDVVLAAPESVVFPITLGLGFGWGFGDVWTGSPRYEVQLSSPGVFTVEYDTTAYVAEVIAAGEVDAEQWQDYADNAISRARRDDPIEWVGAGCSLEIEYSPDWPVVDDLLHGDVVVADLVSPNLTAPEGTLQHLAQTADLTDPAGVGRVWAHLYGNGWSPVAPVVWLHPQAPINYLQEEWTFGGRCYTVNTGYNIADAYFSVWQHQGCAARGPGPDQQSTTRELDGWTLAVTSESGEGADEFAALLKPFFNTEPSDSPPPRGETIAEVEYEGAPIYIVRIEHDGGYQEILLESLEMTLDGPHSGANGETWRGCWQTTVYEPGIALILVGDPTWEVTLGGETLNLIDADGVGAAVLSWTSSQPPRPNITFPEGETCS